MGDLGVVFTVEKWSAKNRRFEWGVRKVKYNQESGDEDIGKYYSQESIPVLGKYWKWMTHGESLTALRCWHASDSHLHGIVADWAPLSLPHY